MIVDCDLRYLLAGGEGLAVAGLSPTALEGKTIHEALPPELSREYEPHFLRALAGTPFVVEKRSFGHDFLTQGTPLFDEEGKVYALLAVSYDVTRSAERALLERERSRAEAALRLSENRFRQLVTTVSDSVFQMSPDWSETRSLTTSEVLGESLDPRLTWIDTYIPDPDSERVREAVRQAIASKGVFELEHRARQADGSIGWAFSRAIPLLDEAGEIVEWVGASSITTDSKRIEDALRASEQRYRSVVTSMSEGLMLGEAVRTDDGEVDLRFLEVNPAYERITGLTRDQLLGRSSRQVMPRLEQYWYDAAARAGLDGETVEFEQYAAPFNRWLEVRYSPAGEPGDGKLVSVAADVTVRHEAEEALHRFNETLEQQVKERTEELRRSQLRFQQAFDLGPMAAAITTLDEDRFLNVNRSFCKLTGYTEDEMVGRTATELHMWSDARDRAKLRAGYKESGNGYQELELRLQTKDGSIREILASGKVLRFDSTQAWLKLFIDTTERKRSEEDLMAAIEAVFSDTTWFGRQVVERLTNIRSGGPGDAAVDELTTRELQVLERIAGGMTNTQIAGDLGITQKTIRNHIANIYSKLDVNSRAQAVVWARERGILG